MIPFIVTLTLVAAIVIAGFGLQQLVSSCAATAPAVPAPAAPPRAATTATRSTRGPARREPGRRPT